MLLGYVDRDGRAEPFLGPMQVVAKLQRQPVLPRRQLHVDDVLAIAEMHPWRRPGNHGVRRKAVRIDAHVVVGARVPILIPSRVESAEDKLHSIALGVLMAGGAS